MAQTIKNAMKDFFKKSFTINEESYFRFSVGFQMMMIPIITGVMGFAFIYVFLQINLLFFEANGFLQLEELREAFFQITLGGVNDYVLHLFLFLVINFLIGMYVAHMLIRPFKIIGDYCLKAINSERATYNPGFFSDLRVLTSFSEFFFNICDSARANGELQDMKIPARYKSIHRPIFERSFFFHYFVFVAITAISTMAVIYVVIGEIYDAMIGLAVKQLEGNQSMQLFFNGESEIFGDIIFAVMALYLLLSVLLTSYLYSKVGAPSFAIFSTMRSFIKGNRFSRVHLIGSYFLRPHCRNINKFLEYMENEFVKKEV